MNVLVYVEGPSDRSALEVLLAPIISEGRTRQCGIRFFPQEGKATILKDCGRKAAEYLAEHPEDWVFALPDLYPMRSYDGTADQHQSFGELEILLRGRFEARAERIGVPTQARGRFRIHCLKHDLEGLILAASGALRRRLGTTDALTGQWRRPVEDQNDNTPPKRVVEALFSKYRRKTKYTATVDAPSILKQASLDEVVAACPQHFAPFVRELRAIANGGQPT